MDVQPKCVAVGPGGYAVVICIGEVSKCRKMDHSAFFYSVILILLLWGSDFVPLVCFINPTALVSGHFIVLCKL